MALNISDSSIFYVTLKDPEGHELYEGENPIAQGLSVVAYNKKDKAWGCFSWFDKIGNVMRTVELKAQPAVDTQKKLYELTTVEDYTYVFEKVDQRIYDVFIRRLIPHLPDIKGDQEIQTYLMGLNPYS